MKRTIAAVVLLLFIIAASICGNIVIDKCRKDIAVGLEECRRGYTEQKVKDLNNIWYSYKPYLFIFVNHETLEEIEKDINLLDTYKNAKEEEYIIACDEIEYDVGRIKEKEDFSILNVF